MMSSTSTSTTQESEAGAAGASSSSSAPAPATDPTAPPPAPPATALSGLDASDGGLWIEELQTQRDVAQSLAKELAQDLDAKKTLLEGRLENALRLCAEAEVRLSKANREYQSKHLTLRKRMLAIVATLASSSFVGWLIAALVTQRFPLGAVLILPVSVAVGVALFGRLEGEDGLLRLAWS